MSDIEHFILLIYLNKTNNNPIVGHDLRSNRNKNKSIFMK